MDIGPDTVVTMDVEISDIWGQVLERSAQPLQYLHGGHGDAFPVLENALEGHRAGEVVEVRVEPEDAFGDYDENLLQVRKRASLPESIEIGMRLEGDPQGEDQGRIFTITDIAGDSVVLDANHPLSGMALKFRCSILEVRAASPEELAGGSVDDVDSVIMRALP